MRRNAGPAWTGIVARHGPEYAVVRGLDQGRRTVTEGLGAFKHATVAVIAQAQRAGAIAEADQTATGAISADQRIVVIKGEVLDDGEEGVELWTIAS